MFALKNKIKIQWIQFFSLFYFGDSKRDFAHKFNIKPILFSERNQSCLPPLDRQRYPRLLIFRVQFSQDFFLVRFHSFRSPTQSFSQRTNNKESLSLLQCKEGDFHNGRPITCGVGRLSSSTGVVLFRSKIGHGKYKK